jgi:peptidoglycan-associated lipoprotein
MMRASLPATLLLSLLLGACASTKDVSANKHISQEGPLKVHPGLLGQPVPTELAPEASATKVPAAASTEVAENPIKFDQTGLRTQRSVYFDYNSAAVKTDSTPLLQAHARYLASHPQSRVRIEGNADERGGADYNARLGLQRAENVRQAMIQQGASARQVAVKTLGEAHPKLKGHDEESWAENRRADVVYEKEI